MYELKYSNEIENDLIHNPQIQLFIYYLLFFL